MSILAPSSRRALSGPTLHSPHRVRVEFSRGIDARTGHVATFTRASSATLTDSAGVVVTVAHSRPRLEPRLWLGGGAAVGLRMTTDDTTYPCEWTPEDGTLVVSGIDLGTAAVSGAGLAYIGRDDATGNRLVVRGTGTSYAVDMVIGANTSTATFGSVIANGDKVDLAIYLNDDGTSQRVRIGGFVNGVAVTVSAFGATIARGGSWGAGAKLRLNRVGSAGTQGNAWFREVSWEPGAPTLSIVEVATGTVLERTSLAVTAGTITGATLAATVLASSLTSVGTLSALNVTGTVILGTDPGGSTVFRVGGDANINGVRVGRGGSGASNNTVVGNNAGTLITSGTNTVAVGLNAAAALTTGTQNTAVGQAALNANQTGAQNTAVGARTLEAATGNNNTAIGFAAGLLTTTGAANVALGQGSLQSNMTGSSNVAAGADALFSVTGSQNIGVGVSAGSSLTTGNNNTIIASIAGTAGLSDTVIIGAGSTERLRIDSNGYLSFPTRFAFNGKTPIAAVAAPAVATDLASAITLANDLRTRLINLGVYT